MADKRDQFSVDLRSISRKRDVVLTQAESLVFSVVAETVPVPRLMKVSEKVVAFCLVFGFFASPFGWVFADEESAPEPPPAAEESAPAPEPVAEAPEGPPPAPIIDPGPVEEPENEPSVVEEVTNNEEIAEPEESNSEETPEETLEEPAVPVEEVDTELEAGSDDVAESEEEISEVTEENTEEASSEETQSDSENSEVTESGDGGQSASTSGGGGSTDVASTTAATTTQETEGVEESSDSATSTPAQEDNSETDMIEASQAENDVVDPGPQEEVTQIASVAYTDNDSRQVFSATDCVMVREGEFYCVRAGEPSGQSTPAAFDAAEDGIVSARKDADGDKEIFFNINGTVTQITHNTVDDDSPIYDPESDVIVWHSLINDRYQIMRYDVATGQTQQLTHTTYNNTNPYAQGTMVVWQGWVGNNWEIFMSQGGVAPVQITDNDYHDMFPKVYTRFITWQARQGDIWQSYLYDTVSGSTSQVGDGEGGFESPRFVLMVERRNENGDIERVGYDINTGESIELGVLPKSVPEEPVVPEDPMKDQKSVLPVTQSTSTPKTSSEDDDSDLEG